MNILFTKYEKFYPECHDAGKLIYTYKEGQDKHWEFLEKLETEWQRAIFQHHFLKEDFLKENIANFIFYFIREIEIYLVILADHFASSYSRIKVDLSDKPNYIVNKLWDKNKWNFDKYRENGENSFYELYTSIGKNYKQIVERLKSYFDSEPSNFLNDFEKELSVRAEDAHPARNIVSLYTHLYLTKKWYLVLREIIEENTNLIELFEKIKEKIKKFEEILEKNKLPQKEEVSKIYNEIKNIFNQIQNECSAFIVNIEFIFPQYFYKVHDLYIFKKLQTEINQILKDENFEKYLFSQFDFDILFIIPKSKKDTLEEKFLKLIEKYPIYIRINESDSNRKIKSEILKRPFEYLNKNFFVPNVYELSDKINILCEVCKINEADKFEEDEKVYYLCEKCNALRSEGKENNPFVNYGNWEEGEIAFLFFNIDKNNFKEWIQEIYKIYLEVQGFPKELIEKTEIENDLVFKWEFDKDIKKALKNFEDYIKEKYGENNYERIIDVVYLIRLNDESERFSILEDIYNFIIKNNFSSLVTEVKSVKPLRIILSFNKVKYPFFLNWRNIQEFKNTNEKDLIMILPDNPPFSLSYTQLESFLKYLEFLKNEDLKFAKSKLYQLIEIAKVSKELAKIELDSFKDYSENYYPYKIPENLLESIDLYTFLILIEMSLNYFKKDKNEK